VRHISALSDLKKKERADLLELVDKSIEILKLAMKPDGFNVGLNLGKVAGAGIEEHLHFHIVPRWLGDTNAIAVFADIRVIPEHLKTTYNNLKPHFKYLTFP
ncbi:MAG: adenylyltransferase, partial [Thermodesulfobacteriota bacterium]|nr:adenylyltransferase [Thermodesulfobacteriota bacterium]